MEETFAASSPAASPNGRVMVVLTILFLVALAFGWRYAPEPVARALFRQESLIRAEGYADRLAGFLDNGAQAFLDGAVTARDINRLQGVAATRPRSVFSFEMLTRDLRKESIRNDGVSASRQSEHLFAGSKTVLTRPGGQAYRLSDTGLQLIQAKSGQTQPLPMPPQFPELSWPTAVAYDDSQDIVAVASMGGEGFLYRFDVKRQRWLDYQSLDNFDITSLAYETNGKRYVGWTSDGSLVYVSNRGKVLQQKRLAELMPGLGYLYDRGNETAPVLLLAPLGSQTALVHFHDDKVSMIWTYDETTEQAQLTYRRAMVTSEKPQPLR
jgi:hypothetical protein